MADPSTLARKDGVLGRARELQLVVMANNMFARYPLPGHGTVVLGRGEDADVSVEDPLVSRRHAQIHVGEILEVEDLAGRNGTYVGGRRLTAHERVPVRTGETIGIGEAIAVVQPRQGRADKGPGVDQLSTEGTSALRKIPPHIVIVDESMRRVYALASLAARSPINVLLLGETGVGKELLAQTLHAWSPRADGPFVSLNCASFSDTLLESELFGYEKGAFTSAAQSKPGLLEVASSGTVFLDEVGDMPPALQARLLRVLETKEIRRLGGVKTRTVDVRFVSATNRDVTTDALRGGFRRDLYFRLNGLTLHIPPLRERPAEIDQLASRFIEDASRKMGRDGAVTLSAEALAKLHQHGWPGNARELKNVMERAVLLSRGKPIQARHIVLDGDPGEASLPAPSDVRRGSGRSAGVKDELAGIERRRITDALERFGGNQTRVAKHLGISRSTLLKRLDEYGLSRPRKNAG